MPWRYARRKHAPETTCPCDNLPRRLPAPRRYASKTMCNGDSPPQEDNMPLETMCPRDNVPPRKYAVEDGLQWETAFGERRPSVEDDLQ